ncbi:hypothetical protein [Anaerotignum sp.]
MAHNTLNGGTVTEIGGGKAMLNGTVYEVDSGKALSGGTVCPITFAEKCTVTLIVFFRYNAADSAADKNICGPEGIGIVLKNSAGSVKSADMYEGLSGGAVLPSAYTWETHLVGTQTCEEGSETKSTYTLDACIGDTMELWVQISDGNKEGQLILYVNDVNIGTMAATDTNADETFTGDECYVSHSVVLTGNTIVNQSSANDGSGGPMATIKITMEG